MQLFSSGFDECPSEAQTLMVTYHAICEKSSSFLIEGKQVLLNGFLIVIVILWYQSFGVELVKKYFEKKKACCIEEISKRWEANMGDQANDKVEQLRIPNMIYKISSRQKIHNEMYLHLFCLAYVLLP